jgi:monolysocardiolipin acyltransferase
MNEVLDRLNSGSWLHIFPEGKVNMEKELMRLKWGVGRLIADATKTPIVLPFMHYGIYK